MENKLMKKNSDNGLTIIGDTFLADSGFNYASGYRNFGNLEIVEEVAGGIGVTFLCGIKVIDKEGVLIIDKNIEKGFHYEREAVRKIVLNELLKMLIDVNQENDSFDEENARITIDIHLKDAYFKHSHKAINSWALELGILKN